MKRVGFRARLFFFLLAFALVPSVLLTLAWGATVRWALPLVGATAALESIAASGEKAIAAARSAPLEPSGALALEAHRRALSESALRARQLNFVTRRAPTVALVVAVTVVLFFGLVASRVAGHLSRNLGRPLRELVNWAERIGRGEPLPDGPPRKGAPEFEVLRTQMRIMARELELGRARALEAERAAAFRETARQVAHELKNPLTPIRFAVDRLRRTAPDDLRESVEVLAVESERLERIARAFAQFGRLPEGPRAPVDVGELVRYTARATVPADMPLDVDVADDVPMVSGHLDALARAVSNVLINAVEACGSAGPEGRVSVRVAGTTHRGRDAVEVTVADSGCGIPADRISRIWDPYVTSKPGGTGLGLAIVRQTVAAHNGEVAAESVPGGGTTIRLVLPADGARVREPALAE
ncbi:MAG: PAS domain-containing sensor histidine kinase [Gemmatimonadaceae bacterium]